MKKIVISLCFLCLLVSQIQAQKEITVTVPRLRIGLEAGVNALFGTINKPDRIRQTASYYNSYNDDYYGSYPSERSFFVADYFGVKAEYTLSKRFAVATGLRFSTNEITLKSDSDFAIFNRNYFLWKISEDGLNTDYVTIQSISQKNRYIGIPLEVKFFPLEMDYHVRCYFIAGIALNVLVKSTNNVQFRNYTMEKYLPTVREQIGKPSIFQGNAYLGFGLKLGNSKYPFGNAEFYLPVCAFYGNKSKSLINASSGFGIRATFQIPIYPEHQLTYTVTD